MYGPKILEWLNQGHSVQYICEDLMNFCQPSCNAPPRGCECGDADNFCKQDCPLPATASCSNNCTPSSDPVDFSICDWYTSQEQLQWLPTAYAKSAHCACLLETVPGRASNTAKCVRKHLIDAHISLNSTLISVMKSWKAEYCTDIMCDPQYLLNIETYFIPIAYVVHVNAYKSCCCPKTPAPYKYWMALMLNYKGIVPCTAIASMIEANGPCGCENW